MGSVWVLLGQEISEWLLGGGTAVLIVSRGARGTGGGGGGDSGQTPGNRRAIKEEFGGKDWISSFKEFLQVFPHSLDEQWDVGGGRSL